MIDPNRLSRIREHLEDHPGSGTILSPEALEIVREPQGVREILKSAGLWGHHGDCRPLSSKGCECGLGRAHAYAREIDG